MKADELHFVLRELSKRRPIFHSEADFQHELALELNRSGWECRLEVPITIKVKGEKAKAEVDLLARSNKAETFYAIELKYVSAKLKASYREESFDLSQNWGVNLSRFDCLADWQRLASIVDSGSAQAGFAVFMTNYEDAWTRDLAKAKNPPMAREMSIHEGRNFRKGDALDWHPQTPSVGAVSKKRLPPYSPIICPASVSCVWTDYSHERAEKNGQFRYLLLET